MAVVLDDRILKPVGVLTDLLSPTTPGFITVNRTRTVLGFDDEHAIPADNKEINLGGTTGGWECVNATQDPQLIAAG